MLADDPFLQTILTHADHDGPRLVYADWLEERGECARAEFIRLQCLGGPEERIRQLLEENGVDWAGAVARHAYGYAFRRGFVEEITITGQVLLDRGHDILASCPVRLIRIIGVRRTLDRLLESPWLSRIRALHLTGCRIGDEGAARLADCPYLKGLHTLRLGSNAIGDQGIEWLADSPHLPALRSLVLHGNLIGDTGVRVLATAKFLHGLQAIDLSDNLIGEAGAEALARSARFPRLQRLDLSNQHKDSATSLALRVHHQSIQALIQESRVRQFGGQASVS